jgi:hypothetical protein
MNLFRCDDCGRFIPYRDIEDGAAMHRLVYPDSFCTRETYETVCRCCRAHSEEATWPPPGAS